MDDEKEYSIRHLICILVLNLAYGASILYILMTLPIYECGYHIISFTCPIAEFNWWYFLPAVVLISQFIGALTYRYLTRGK